MGDLPQRYDPVEREQAMQSRWEEEKTYAFDPDSDKEVYSIDTPPPTVSGAMHIGHAFSYAQQDFIARYKRMRGYSVFYPFGTDDNGLATEKLVEKTKKVSSKKMDREAFVQLCLETLEEIRPAFIADWKRLGISSDFSIYYSTINEHCRKLSQQSFIDLYKEGRIYRKKAPIIFCPSCKTAIAQVEMEDSERKSTLNYVKAKVETGEYIIYATTRPELHPACIGISLDENGMYVTVKQGDEEWIISKDAVEKLQGEFPMEIVREYKGKELVGKNVAIPYAIREQIPISHDVSAKTEYGTGVVYYCSYGGLDCVEWLPRHPEVEPEHIMDESGTYTKGPYAGLRSPEARKKVLEDLEKDGHLLKKENIKHVANVHERCGTDVEYVATRQWFLKYLDLKDDFLKAGAALQWVPPHMQVRYDNWVKGLQWDWCVSRQRHFGVPIPVWYDSSGEVVLPDPEQLPVDPLQDAPEGHTPETDVLDTWATSSLTPHLAVDLFKDHPVHGKLFPMSLRPQAHDIITFWLFNTVVKSQLHHGKNPWETVTISGFALDPHGRKMSKSKGNVVHPQEVIEKYGADALRFWAAGAKLGDDMPYQEKELVTGKKTVTKLWNASKFVLMNLEGYTGKPEELEAMDRWILHKANALVKKCTEAFDAYDHSKAKFDVELFFWRDFCDNYLEIVKGRLYGDDASKKASAQYALLYVLETVLKLFAPFMPYITEEIYQLLPEERQSIHTSAWPEYVEELVDAEHARIGNALVAVLTDVRKHRAENQLSMKAPLQKLVAGSQWDLERVREDLQTVTNAEELVIEKDGGALEWTMID